MAIKLIEVELSQPIEPLTDLERYEEVWFLVKLHSLPVGNVKLPVISPSLMPDTIIEHIVTWLAWPILTHLLEDDLIALAGDQATDLGLQMDQIEKGPVDVPHFRSGRPKMGTIQNLLTRLNGGLEAGNTEPPCLQWRRRQATWFVTVAVCTRDGAERLGPCLEALEALDYPNYEILVVDNAPQDNATWKLVEQRETDRYRYIIEPRPGVSWARNRAIQEARGDVIAFTDDDARPDRFWLLSLVTALQRPGISLVTGRAYPQELENKAQIHCAKFWGHDKSFQRRQYSLRFKEFPRHPYNSHQYGGSYNLAAWREVFQKIGGYDVALGRGAPSGSASDTDLIYRLLRQGYITAYEPTALVRLAYPSDFRFLRQHNRLGASGIYAFLTKCFINEPRHRGPVLWYALKTFFQWYVWPHLQQRFSRQQFSKRLLLSSMLGALAGPRNYLRSLKQARKLAASDLQTNPGGQPLVDSRQ